MSNVINFGERRTSLLANKACSSLFKLLDVSEGPIKLPQSHSELNNVRNKIAKNISMIESVEYIDLVLDLNSSGYIVLENDKKELI